MTDDYSSLKKITWILLFQKSSNLIQVHIQLCEQVDLEKIQNKERLLIKLCISSHCWKNYIKTDP